MEDANRLICRFSRREALQFDYLEQDGCTASQHGKRVGCLGIDKKVARTIAGGILFNYFNALKKSLAKERYAIC